jgi:hypothetical protein
VGGIFRTTHKLVLDHRQNAFDTRQHVGIPEAEDPIAVRLKILAPNMISIGILHVHVLASIDFDNDPCSVAREIREEGAHWDLSSKVQVRKRPPDT